MKLFDSELKVLEVLWDGGDQPAKEIAKRLKADIGWNKNTTYTVINKCIAKNAIERVDPGFICTPLVSRREIQLYETNELIQKMYHGSAQQFFSALLSDELLSDDEILQLKELINNHE